MKSIEEEILSRLSSELQPSHLQVINESHMHGNRSGESHYKVVIATPAFADLKPIQRHRKINSLLADLLAGPIHALALHTFSDVEWQQTNAAPASPACLGGSKSEH